VKAELEVFDSGMAAQVHALLERDLLDEPPYVNLMLGGHHTAPATLRELAHLVDSLPQGTVWAAGGIGAFQQKATALAVFAGGHVRTGLEDAARLAPKGPMVANSDLVSRAADLAALAGRRLASPR